MWLAERRKVTGIGVDTISLDPGNSTTFPVHVNFLATDRYGLENLTNPTGSRPTAPWPSRLDPVGGGLSGPCRVIASW
jgi:kynurenine formamidase